MPEPLDAGAQATVAAVLRGDPRTCGRLITRIEAGDAGLAAILQALYRQGGRTPVVGITGAPGAGKSTLVDQLIARYRARGARLAVLAIDPASPFSGGAILGDRVRMARHNADAGVFIRSMSARGMLGGLARAAGDALTVLDAMGVDLILLETVGVGQNEVDVMRYARSVLIVLTPASGDGVQAVKAGILEIGDVFAVNKADSAGADRAVAVLREAIEFRHDPHDADAWMAPIVKTQANANAGVEDALDALESHDRHLREHPQALRKRLRAQARLRVMELVNQGLRQRIGHGEAAGAFDEELDAVVERRSDPHALAHALLAKIG